MLAKLNHTKKTTFLFLAILGAFLSFSQWVAVGKVAAAPPKCFNHDGTTQTDCQDVGVNLIDGKCYTELRSGPNGTLTGYSETSCTDATDRDQDGNPGGAGAVSSSEPDYVKNDCNETSLNQDNCGIIKYLVIFINVLSALVGLVVVGSIIYGGIQYSASSGDPSKVSAAKDRIRNAIIALLFFLFSYSILNWLVPGGVL